MRRRASRCAFGADVLLTLVGPKGERLAEARPGERGTRARPHHPDRAHGLLHPVHGLWRALKHWEIAAVICSELPDLHLSLCGTFAAHCGANLA